MIKETDILLDILDHHPRTRQVLKDYEEQLASCICCDMLFASITEICQHYQLDLTTLLNKLNEVSAHH